MYARVSRFQQPSGAPSPSDDSVGREALAAMREVDGFKGLITLDDQASGAAIAITLWDSEEAMTASETHAERVRSDAATATSAQVASVERFRVDVLHLED